ncbi:DsbA family protein [Desulfovibrio sp. OttesenSCG-928-I05]|nr:DsbA family protein [Desulfovibrio sp. OttesenSCG-928-I05]
MQRSIARFVSFLAVFMVAASFAAPFAGAASASSPVTRGELKDLLRQVIRENPDIVMEVLRDNSVEVLEIAQHGSQALQLRSLRTRWENDLKAAPKKVDYNRPVKGNADAPVTIVAYSDYTCPYCATASRVINQVLNARPDTARFIFKNLPLKSNPLARLACEYVTAAYLQDEAKGWALHDAIFENQGRFLDEGEGFLRATALSVGLNLQRLSADIKGKAVKTIIDEDMMEAKEVKATGTPYHLVNNLSVSGAVPLPYFLEAVDIAKKETDGK